MNRPPHNVTVQRMRLADDGRGGFHDAPDGAPIVVPCSVQSAREWSTAEESYDGGLQVLDIVRVFARDWPGDVRSVVYWDESEWETVGSPQHFSMSAKTSHWAVTLKRRGDFNG